MNLVCNKVKYFTLNFQSELVSGNHICDFPQSIRLLIQSEQATIAAIQSELASLIQSEQATIAAIQSELASLIQSKITFILTCKFKLLHCNIILIFQNI